MFKRPVNLVRTWAERRLPNSALDSMAKQKTSRSAVHNSSKLHTEIEVIKSTHRQTRDSQVNLAGGLCNYTCSAAGRKELIEFSRE